MKMDFRPRTQEEILDRTSSRKGLLDTEFTDLIWFLDYKHAKQWLNKDTTEENYNKECKEEYTEEFLLNKITSYIGFAIEKAEGRKGISAARALDHYKTWIWLLGHTEVLSELEKLRGNDYGMAILERIKEIYVKDAK
ncbi:MAG: hypothetical protein ACW99G_18265 [Candidatus Thorarchaeota archaeon]|jgi:hypothetical protein